jgi:DNA transformation protein and related proteins
MMSTDKHFADYCCELLASAGPCVPKRMFGGYGISADGLTLAIIADVGGGEKLWLKGDAATRGRYEAAGCVIFTYAMKGTPRSMNYFTAPEDAMDSPDAMRPWAALALECAVRAQAAKRKPTAKSAAKTPANLAPSKLSHSVLERAREAAKKLALSASLPAASPKAKPSKPLAKRASAPAPKTSAARKSAKGAKTAAQ